MSQIQPCNSFQFAEIPEKAKQFHLLKKRARMRLDEFIPLLKRKGVQNGMQILEIACGQGIRTGQMAKAFPDSKIVGIDTSQEMIEYALAENQVANACFQQADVNQLPFTENSFDVIYARLLFMHLPNSQTVIGNLYRYLKPNGIVIIEDADRDFMKFYPEPRGFRDYWQRIQAGQRRAGGDPNIGSKLATYMAQTGLAVETEMQPIHYDGCETIRIADELLPCLNLYLPQSEQGDGEHLISELRELAQSKSARFYHTWFVIKGVKVL